MPNIKQKLYKCYVCGDMNEWEKLMEHYARKHPKYLIKGMNPRYSKKKQPKLNTKNDKPKPKYMKFTNGKVGRH